MLGPNWDQALRVDVGVTGIIVALDVVEVTQLGHPGPLINVAQVGEQSGVVGDAAHIALEMQTLAGMDTGFGRTRGTGKPGEY